MAVAATFSKSGVVVISYSNYFLFLSLKSAASAAGYLQMIGPLLKKQT